MVDDESMRYSGEKYRTRLKLLDEIFRKMYVQMEHAKPFNSPPRRISYAEKQRKKALLGLVSQNLYYREV